MMSNLVKNIRVAHMTTDGMKFINVRDIVMHAFEDYLPIILSNALISESSGFFSRFFVLYTGFYSLSPEKLIKDVLNSNNAHILDDAIQNAVDKDPNLLQKIVTISSRSLPYLTSFMKSEPDPLEDEIPKLVKLGGCKITEIEKKINLNNDLTDEQALERALTLSLTPSLTLENKINKNTAKHDHDYELLQEAIKLSKLESSTSTSPTSTICNEPNLSLEESEKIICSVCKKASNPNSPNDFLNPHYLCDNCNQVSDLFNNSNVATKPRIIKKFITSEQKIKNEEHYLENVARFNENFKKHLVSTPFDIKEDNIVKNDNLWNIGPEYIAVIINRQKYIFNIDDAIATMAVKSKKGAKLNFYITKSENFRFVRKDGKITKELKIDEFYSVLRNMI
jgi:hypothetical protein